MTQDGQMTEPGGTTPTTNEAGTGGILGHHADVRHLSLLILTLLAVLYTLQLAAPFFLPIVVAILLNLLLSPVVRLLRDHLRAHPAEAARYAELKRKLASQHRDGAAFQSGKSAFIAEMLERARRGGAV